MTLARNVYSERMSNLPNKWEAPELEGGVVLRGKGDSINKPGPHRSYYLSVHLSPRTGYQTVQTCDYVLNPATQNRQLVTITASQFNVRNLRVNRVTDNLREIESRLRALSYECRVLQKGSDYEIQTYLPVNITSSEKYNFEQQVLNIIRSV